MTDDSESGNTPDNPASDLREHGRLMLRYLALLLGSIERTEEVAVLLWREARTLAPPPTSRAGWLRLTRRRAARFVVTAVSRPAPEVDAIAARLGQLPPTDRELLVLFGLCRLTPDELAVIFDSQSKQLMERLAKLTVTWAALRGERAVFEEPAFTAHVMDRLAQSPLSPLGQEVANNDAFRDGLFEVESALSDIGRAASEGDDELDALLNRLSDEQVPEPSLTEERLAMDDSVVTPENLGVHASVGDTKEAGGPTSRASRWDKVWSVLANRRWLARAAFGLLVLSLVGGLALWLRQSAQVLTTDPEALPFEGRVRDVTGSRNSAWLSICSAGKDRCESGSPDQPVRRGDILKTARGARAILDMEDGTILVLGHDTHLSLTDRGGNSATLRQGRLMVEVPERGSGPIAIALPDAVLTLIGGKCAILLEDGELRVTVSRGKAAFRSGGAEPTSIGPGEEFSLVSGQTPFLGQSSRFPEAFEGFAEDEQPIPLDREMRGLGQLRGQKPGGTSESSDVIVLSSHRVDVDIHGVLARTEIEEVFSNRSNDVLEGILRFPVPADAEIERLALEVDGRWEEGAFVDRERAQAIWRGSLSNAAVSARNTFRDEIIWVPGPWRDPALLEWQRGNRFELKIFPIPKLGSRRIKLVYTQLLARNGPSCRYTYPLPKNPEAAELVGEFSFNARIKGADTTSEIRTTGLEPVREIGSEGYRLRYNQRHFVPTGDIGIAFVPENRDRELVAWGYAPKASNDPRGYAALLLRPQLPRRADVKPGPVTLVIDRSRSMYGEAARHSAVIAGRIIGELSSQQSVDVLACDVVCRSFNEESRSATPELGRHVEKWLLEQPADGASDLSHAVSSGLAVLEGHPGPLGHLVYIGDGAPTVGPIRPATLAAAVGRRAGTGRIRFTALGVGVDSDLPSLRAVAQAYRGLVLPYDPRLSLAGSALRVVDAMLRERLSDVQIELPSGLVDQSPRTLSAVAAGDELLVVARTEGSRAKGDLVIRGKVGDSEFTERYPLDFLMVEGERHAFVPRLYAAQRIRDLEMLGTDAARREAIELSTRLKVASRYTSLLVLESPAMFRAFGLDNRRSEPEWTAETELEEYRLERDLDQVDESLSEAWAATTPRKPAMGADVAGELRGAPSGVARAKRAEEPDESLAAPSSPSTLADEAKSSRPQPGRWQPMRRIWERRGTVDTARVVPKDVTERRLAEAERAHTLLPDRRESTLSLFDLSVRSRRFEQAEQLLADWLKKDPLDAEALTRRADELARTARRSLAIRALGGVVDMSPGEPNALRRLERLYRWAGQAEVSCRCQVTLAELRPRDHKALALALACTRRFGQEELHRQLAEAVDATIRSRAEQIEIASLSPNGLVGDLQVSARWEGGEDLDLYLLTPDGHRVSWLGAPTRSLITAVDVVTTSREGLALSNARSGEYVLGIVRGTPEGRAVSEVVPLGSNAEPSWASRAARRTTGTVSVLAGKTRREFTFALEAEENERVLAILGIQQIARLVPAWAHDRSFPPPPTVVR